MASEYETLQAIEKSNSLNPVQKTRLDELRRTMGGGSGSIKMPDLGAFTAGQRERSSKLLSDQNAAQSDFLNRFRSTISAQESLPALYGRLGSELGLPELQSREQMLTSSVRQTPQLQTNAARGMDVNENQRQRIIAAKLAELAPAAQAATEQRQFAEGQLSTRLGLEQAQQQKELIPLTTEQSMLADRMARETALYSQGEQSELNSLLAQYQAGVQMTMAEQQRAHELAMKEKDYTFQLENAKKSVSNNGLVTLSEGQTVFNPTTMKAVYTAPKTYKPESPTVSGGYQQYLQPVSSYIPGANSGRATAPASYAPSWKSL